MNINKSNKGFTIIEVLIVLAIASSILLIVFLAVPSLQRNQRNTQRKATVAALAGAIGEYESNNGGAIPLGAAAVSGNAFKICNTTNCTSATKAVEYNQGYYTVAPTIATALASPSGARAAIVADTVTVVPKGKCTTTNSAIYGSERSVAILYAIEASGGTNGYVSQCLDV